MIVRLALLFLVMQAAACGPAGPEPESYDPPGSTITTGRQIFDQPRRTIGHRSSGVWVSNEYPGARLSDFVHVEDSLYRAIIRPENAPVNKSAWYGFQIWADEPQSVEIELVYEDGEHRYVPKLSPDGRRWSPIAPDRYAADTTTGTARLRLDVGPDTTWVSGQELHTSLYFEGWMADRSRLEGVSQSVIGRSLRGRPIRMLSFGPDEGAEGVVLVIGRQHPPEATGTLALLRFTETLLGDSDEARAFRGRYRTLVVPIVNPDGVDDGHWRHNAAGVDLNRDWLDFNQPEVRVVRDTFLREVEEAGAPVAFAIDFHSTQYDVFYTHERDLVANRPGFVDDWLVSIASRVPGYEIRDEASGLGSPTSKNWFYEAFGTTSVIYEVADEQDRELIDRVATAAAEGLMELLGPTP